MSRSTVTPRLFSPVVVLWLILIGVFSFGAWMALSAYAPDLRRSNDPGQHALSRSAVGYQGLRTLLTARGDTVLVSRNQGRRPHGLLILTPPPGVDAKVMDAIAFEAPELVILPKWGVAPDPFHPGWVSRTGDDLMPLEMVGSAAQGSLLANLTVTRRTSQVPTPVTLRSVSDLLPGDTTYPIGPTESLQTLSGEGWTPVLVDEAGRAVLVKAQDKDLYVLADPDLMNTHGLANLDTANTAVAALDAMRPDHEAVVQDVTLNGFTRARSVLKLAFEPPFLGLTLAALGVALLMALHAAARFGPARTGKRALALGAKALADNSAGLIRLAKREPDMAPAYAAQVRASVARILGCPRNLPGEELDALLDQLGRSRGVSETSSGLTAQARQVSTRADLMRLSDSLNQWKMEMTRDRR